MIKIEPKKGRKKTKAGSPKLRLANICKGRNGAETPKRSSEPPHAEIGLEFEFGKVTVIQNRGRNGRPGHSTRMIARW